MQYNNLLKFQEAESGIGAEGYLEKRQNQPKVSESTASSAICRPIAKGGNN